MTDKPLDVATIGDAVIDLTAVGCSDDGVTIYERNPGGGPANVVTTVARLGGRSAFFGMVGDDHLGRFLAATLAGLGVDVSGIRFSGASGTRLVFIELDEQNDRTFIPYASPRADLEYGPGDLDPDAIEHARIFHTSMLANLTSPLREATDEAIGRVRASGGLISFDPNWAAAASADAASERETIRRVISSTDILKVSLPELEFLVGTQNVQRGSRTLLEAGPRLVVVTLGGDGAYYRTEQAGGLVSAPAIRAIDTTGAGDAFVGGLLYSLARRLAAGQDMDDIGEMSLSADIAFANACGAACASRRGSMRAAPDQNDVAALLIGHD